MEFKIPRLGLAELVYHQVLFFVWTGVGGVVGYFTLWNRSHLTKATG